MSASFSNFEKILLYLITLAIPRHYIRMRGEGFVFLVNDECECRLLLLLWDTFSNINLSNTVLYSVLFIRFQIDTKFKNVQNDKEFNICQAQKNILQKYFCSCLQDNVNLSRLLCGNTTSTNKLNYVCINLVSCKVNSAVGVKLLNTVHPR